MNENFSMQKLLDKYELDALLLSNAKDIRYLTDFACEDCVLLFIKDKPVLITDSRYTIAAQLACPHMEVMITRQGQTYTELAINTVDFSQAKKLGYQDETITAAELLTMQKNTKAELAPIGKEMLLVRAIKDASEIENIKKSQALVEKAFLQLLPFIKEGVTEKQIANKLQYLLLENGAESLSFNTIVASGTNGALPHAVPTDKPVCKGELITLDFGAIYNGYCSDMTRTVALGKPSAQLAEIYQIVLEAQNRAIHSLKSNMHCADADAVARNYIIDKGYGDYFVHSLGHGVGLDIHEAPTLSSRSDAMLEPGMIVTVEPGIYIAGLGGVRIEDMCLITKTGYENLTAADKKLIEL